MWSSWPIWQQKVKAGPGMPPANFPLLFINTHKIGKMLLTSQYKRNKQ